MSYKVMATIILTPFISLALIIGIVLVYAPLSFTDYVNRMALNELDEMVTELAKEYRTQHGWETLKKNPFRWREILRSTQPSPSFLELAIRNQPFSPPEEPASFAIPTNGKPGQEIPYSKPSGHLDRWVRELTLFDTDKRPVAGGSPEAKAIHYTLKAIRLDDHIVGWLGLYKRDHLSDPFIVSFLNEQSTVLYLIGGGILLLTAALSFLLSSHLLAPIRQLDEGIRALAIFRARTQSELGLLASNYDQVTGSIDRYETLKRKRISNSFTELGTSVAVLRSKIEALQDCARKHDGAKIGSLHAEVVRLGRLLDDLNRLSLPIPQGPMIRKAPIKPIQVLRDRLVRYQTRLKQKGIALEMELCAAERFLLTGDADQLAQLFSSLLDNTLRYTDSPGALKIGATVTAQQLTIVFENSAPGLSADAFKRLFERLYQADSSRSPNLSGTGLGLSTCKEIVNAHGGTIQVANSQLGGLKVSINLPLVAKDKLFPLGA